MTRPHMPASVGLFVNFEIAFLVLPTTAALLKLYNLILQYSHSKVLGFFEWKEYAHNSKSFAKEHNQGRAVVFVSLEK